MRAVALLIALGLAGCKRGPQSGTGPLIIKCAPSGCPADESAPKAGGELIVHVEAEPRILCDLVEHDAWSRWILENQVMETLFLQEAMGAEPKPHLAERVEHESDRVVLHLRKNVRWHDGRPFTARDVVYTINQARDPKVGADQAPDLEPISTVEETDASTVSMRLKRPAPLLRQTLSHISILPAHAYAGKDLKTAEASRAPIGTGPFHFVRWKSGQELVIEKNNDYWGPKPQLGRIIFRVVRDKNVAYDLLLRGELDMMWSVPQARLEEILSDQRLRGHRVFVWTPRAYYFLLWNTESPLFADARVRRALAHAIDRERFLRVAFSGHARALTGPFLPGSPFYDESVESVRYDPALARKLLAEAGRGTFQFTFLAAAGSRSAEQLATLMKEDLGKIGISMDIATVDFGVLLNRLRRHSFEVSALQWTIDSESSVYQLFHSSQVEGGQNYGGWKNAEADAMLERIRSAELVRERQEQSQKLHRLINEQQPYTFLGMPEVETLVRSRVHNVRPSADGFGFARVWVDP